jgi:hypothetical protein
MVGKHNIKVRVVLTYQVSLLGLLWTLLDLGQLRCQLMGIISRAEFRPACACGLETELVRVIECGVP